MNNHHRSFLCLQRSCLHLKSTAAHGYKNRVCFIGFSQDFCFMLKDHHRTGFNIFNTCQLNLRNHHRTRMGGFETATFCRQQRTFFRTADNPWFLTHHRNNILFAINHKTSGYTDWQSISTNNVVNHTVSRFKTKSIFLF